MDIGRGNELGCHGPRRLRTLEDLLPSCTSLLLNS
jgi:hypothetical protein